LVEAKASNPFVLSQMPLLIDQLAQRYHLLPHQILDQSIEDIQIDYLCYEAGVEEENRQARKAYQGAKH